MQLIWIASFARQLPPMSAIPMPVAQPHCQVAEHKPATWEVAWAGGVLGTLVSWGENSTRDALSCLCCMLLRCFPFTLLLLSHLQPAWVMIQEGSCCTHTIRASQWHSQGTAVLLGQALFQVQDHHLLWILVLLLHCIIQKAKVCRPGVSWRDFALCSLERNLSVQYIPLCHCQPQCHSS